MKITLLQINTTIGDLESNAKKILIKAKKNGKSSDLIISPELSLLGYPPRDLLLYKSFIDKAFTALEKLADDAKSLPPILIGTAIFDQKAKALKNAAVLVQGGQIKSYFYKSLLPSYDVFNEERYFINEKNPQILNLAGKKIGISICEDLWNDKDFWGQQKYSIDPIKKLAQEKVDLIINMSASPFTVSKQDLREKMIASTAKKYSMPIIYVNQVGANEHLVFDGASIAFNKNGVLLARAKAFEEDCLVVNFNKPNIAPYPQNNEERLYKALVLGLKDYLLKSGFKKVVLGLSGGIDSALVATLAMKALGAKSVLGILMPSPYTSKRSITDAKKLATNLKIQTSTIDIKPLMKSFKRALAKSFKGYSQDTTEENIQSRIRANLLMALSNKYKSLLLSTGNKSELTVGYTTLYGDLSGGLAPIGDLTKTQVYALCKWLNTQQELIPESIIKKAPSAELKPNQKDQDTLPPYETLDRILFQHIENQKGKEEIIKEGFNKKTVDKILKMLNNAEYKRRQAPPTIKVTEKAFGPGWQMPMPAHKNF